MAEIRSIYTDKRKDDSRRRTGYVEGTAVRKLSLIHISSEPGKGMAGRRENGYQFYD